MTPTLAAPAPAPAPAPANGQAPPAAPCVFLAVPHYGEVASATAGALLTASAKLTPYINFECGSLLAFTFNRLWCEALNMRAQRGVDFFAMLHADVCPDPFWLDTLLAEMGRVGADVISAVVPIKDPRGLTSTARQDAKAGTHLRLTMKEVFRLPPTFSAESAGWGADRLLVNTGCWACRLDRPWVDEFSGFTIRDWLQRDAGGTVRPGVFSEDWNASEWWADHGVKVFATRKVALGHVGRASYRNETPWGEWEEDYGDARDPAEAVHGWMKRGELEWLRRKARGCRAVVEVGSWHGRSTLALAGSCPGTVYAVDHFRGSPGDRDQALAEADESGPAAREAFTKNLAGHLESGKVRLLEGDSRQVAQDFFCDGLRPDLVFLDGAHDYESVRADIRAWRPRVRAGGVLAGHDRDRPGVRAAIDELCGGWKAGPGSIWETTA
jgi:predicted O-methyltransferase YrrM